jgi:hypothetical protein
LVFRLKLLKMPITSDLVSLIVFPEARIGLGFPFISTKKAYHSGFNELHCNGTLFLLSVYKVYKFS